MSTVKTGGQTVNQALRCVTSPVINIDNGAGTTLDIVLLVPSTAITIHSMYVLYTTATAGTVAAGNVKIGTTVGGAEIVAATAFADGATVGTEAALTLVIDEVAAGVPILIRHTGIATTVAGEYIVQMEYAYDA